MKTALEQFVAGGQAAQEAADRAIDNAATTIAGLAEVAKKSRSLNPTRFLCRSEVRNFLLAYAAAKRTHKFTRVSEETLISINEKVRSILADHVHRLPSKGKTI